MGVGRPPQRAKSPIVHKRPKEGENHKWGFLPTFLLKKKSRQKKTTQTTLNNKKQRSRVLTATLIFDFNLLYHILFHVADGQEGKQQSRREENRAEYHCI